MIMPAPASATDWPVNEQTKTYAISGSTGSELYFSIGERGPRVGSGRAIAHTTFDLKWSRDYRPQPDGSCLLAAARPFITIIYTIPKPSGQLPAATRRLWDVFIDGIRRHEKVHGDQIREMVERIHATTVGLSVPNDPGCREIRKAIQAPLAAASQEQRRRSAEYDREEMRDGGAVHSLILNLVNGG
ncbi:MAG: DUF922 domain-containing protein [Rhizobiaceae bacterium]|nr:DUF922 domain-containing protein [Rhizobiaceae bacterium]